jgi:hypothetical protein
MLAQKILTNNVFIYPRVFSSEIIKAWVSEALPAAGMKELLAF